MKKVIYSLILLISVFIMIFTLNQGIFSSWYKCLTDILFYCSVAELFGNIRDFTIEPISIMLVKFGVEINLAFNLARIIFFAFWCFLAIFSFFKIFSIKTLFKKDAKNP